MTGVRTADVPAAGGARSGDTESARRREARALDEALLSLVRRGWDDPASEEEVETLAARLHRHQARHNPAAAAWWRGLGVEPAGARGWRDVPPLPVTAFRDGRVAAFPARGPHEPPTFVSSGTTSASRSRVHMEGLAVYEAVVAAGFRRHALPERERIRLLFLAPEPAGRSSSLLHMFGVLRERFGAPGSAFLARGGDAVDPAPLACALDEACAAGEPAVLLGAAFAFVHALEGLERIGARWSLPAGSRLFQTGGFKGRSREVAPAQLLEAYAERFGIGRAAVLHEYGMAELASQFYARDGEPFVGPPWVRWGVLDPLTLQAAAPGEAGVLVVWDLANRSTCFALRTQDLVRARGSGFDLLGRLSEAELRGCSLEADRAVG